MAPQIVKPSAASEPSEPSSIKPEDKSKEQLTGTQEENPQIVAHTAGKQAGDAKERGDKVAKEGFAGSGYAGDSDGSEEKKGRKARL